MLKSHITLTGHLIIQKFDEDMNLIYSTEVPNLVVTAGKAFVASRIVGTDLPAMGYMAIGDDATISDLTQTTLIDELARVSTTSASYTGTNVTFSATFPSGSGTGSIVEAGIFNRSTASVIMINAATDVNAGTDVISHTNHGFNTGDTVTYTTGGGTAIGGLTQNTVYYIIKLTANTFQLALTASDASLGNAINISTGVGATHKFTHGDMLCRTTFPVITKSSSQTIAISWVVSVG